MSSGDYNNAMNNNNDSKGGCGLYVCMVGDRISCAAVGHNYANDSPGWLSLSLSLSELIE